MEAPPPTAISPPPFLNKQGLSYDRYVGYWGDISHRHMVAGGSNGKYDSTASFAEVTPMATRSAFIHTSVHAGHTAVPCSWPLSVTRGYTPGRALLGALAHNPTAYSPLPACPHVESSYYSLARGLLSRHAMLALAPQMELFFDPEPILRFTPHLADDARKGDVDGADANGRWGPWRKQVCLRGLGGVNGVPMGGSISGALRPAARDAPRGCLSNTPACSVPPASQPTCTRPQPRSNAASRPPFPHPLQYRTVTRSLFPPHLYPGRAQPVRALGGAV